MIRTMSALSLVTDVLITESYSGVSSSARERYS